MNKRHWLALLALSAIIAAEAAARIVLGLGDPPLSMAHPTVEYMYRPNQDVMRFGNRFIVNEYGMRSEQFPRHKVGDEARIMVFGDSVLNGGNLTDHESLATTLLEHRFQEQLGRTVRVGNISAGSWGPGNWLAYAREFGFFDADTVVLVVSSHDAADNTTFAPLNPNTHPQAKPIMALVEGATRYLPRYLGKAGADTAPAPTEGDRPAEMQRGLSDLREFLVLALAKTPGVLLLQHAERVEIESGMFKPGHAEIERIATDLHIPVIQLAPAFQEAIGRGEQPYRDNIHPNEIGQRLIASVLLKQLTAQ